MRHDTKYRGIVEEAAHPFAVRCDEFELFGRKAVAAFRSS